MILRYSGKSNNSFKDYGTYKFDPIKEVILDRNCVEIDISTIDQEDFSTMTIVTGAVTLLEFMKSGKL